MVREHFFLDLSFVPKRFLTTPAAVAMGKVPQKQERLNLNDLPSCTQNVLVSPRLEANAGMVLRCQAAGLILKILCAPWVSREIKCCEV